MIKIARVCPICTKDFEALEKEVNRGNGIFCSRSCAAKNRPKKEPNVICAQCNKDFYKPPKRRSLSKSGLFFCTRECKDKAQRIDGIKAIQPPHYGTAVDSYRDIAFNNYVNSCNRCGWNQEPMILEVHHKDHNRDNNLLENLEILCPTCHQLHHYYTHSGRYSLYRNKSKD